MFSRLLTLLLIFVLGTLFGWLILPGILDNDGVTVAGNQAEADRNTLESRFEDLQAKVEALAGRIGDGARNLGNNAADAIQDMKGDAEEAGAETREKTQTAVTGARDELGEFKSDIEKRLDAIERALKAEGNEADEPPATEDAQTAPAVEEQNADQPAN